jgi:uncharacterized protein YndB with AHSA1/START domain
MTAATIPPIEGKTTVNVPVEQAFTVFTESFTAWWPHQYHIGSSDVAEVILESHEGGRWYERGVDGTECDWGRVLAWEPPNRVLFTWQINGRWQFDPDPTTPARSRSASTPTVPPRPPSRSNTATSSAWSTARACTAPSAAAVAGPPCSTATPAWSKTRPAETRPAPTRPARIRHERSRDERPGHDAPGPR